jgi:hypothetical protein
MLLIVGGAASAVVATSGDDAHTAATAGGDQADGVVGCADRAEPTRRPGGRGNLTVGPVTFLGLRRAARASRRDFTRERGDYLGWKSGIVLRADTEVTVAAAKPDRRVLKLDYAGTGGMPVKAATFTACPRDEPAFSHDGTVGGHTGFAGAFLAARRRCIRLRISIAGRPKPAFRTVSFGAGRCGARTPAPRPPGRGGPPFGSAELDADDRRVVAGQP